MWCLPFIDWLISNALLTYELRRWVHAASACRLRRLFTLSGTSSVTRQRVTERRMWVQEAGLPVSEAAWECYLEKGICSHTDPSSFSRIVSCVVTHLTV